MTTDKLVEEMNSAIQIPGLTNAWTMPIKTRIDMLSTGIKTPVGIKIAGPDLNVLQDIGKEIEELQKQFRVQVQLMPKDLLAEIMLILISTEMQLPVMDLTLEMFRMFLCLLSVE